MGRAGNRFASALCAYVACGVGCLRPTRIEARSSTGSNARHTPTSVLMNAKLRPYRKSCGLGRAHRPEEGLDKRVPIEAAVEGSERSPTPGRHTLPRTWPPLGLPWWCLRRILQAKGRQSLLSRTLRRTRPSCFPHTPKGFASTDAPEVRELSSPRGLRRLQTLRKPHSGQRTSWHPEFDAGYGVFRGKTVSRFGPDSPGRESVSVQRL